LHGSAVVAGERLTAKEYIFAWLNERLPDLGVVSRIDVEEGELAVDFDGRKGSTASANSTSWSWPM
jgi:hypothetical protein